jgi:hypothetical protein
VPARASAASLFQGLFKGCELVPTHMPCIFGALQHL